VKWVTRSRLPLKIAHAAALHHPCLGFGGRIPVWSHLATLIDNFREKVSASIQPSATRCSAARRGDARNVRAGQEPNRTPYYSTDKKRGEVNSTCHRFVGEIFFGGRARRAEKFADRRVFGRRVRDRFSKR
jgi:hypothetical protein